MRYLLLAVLIAAPVPPKDEETLIIAGPGISANIDDKGGILEHVNAMFNTQASGYKPVTVRFKGNTAQMGDIKLAAELDNEKMIQGAALRVGKVTAQEKRTILALDMDLYGKNITVLKGAGAMIPTSLYPKGPDPERMGQVMDRIRTDWNRETERASKFIQAAAEEYKKLHPNGKVIVLGHSAFTNAIDLVPTAKDGKQLIDLRVLSSPMPGKISQSDPKHTIIVSHEKDLPSAFMGNVYSPRSKREWEKEGTVVTLKGGLGRNPVMHQFEAHSKTQQYQTRFEMEVNNRPVNGLMTPAEIIKTQLATPAAQRTPEALRKKLETHAPKESKVGGGVSFTLPAEVPLNGAEAELVLVDGRLAFRTSEGTLRLPTVAPAVDATAYLCLFESDNAGKAFARPELSMRYAQHENRTVKVIDYLSAPLFRSRLGEMMAEADEVLGDIAWGQHGRRPLKCLPRYLSYAEASLDKKPDSKLNGRVWVAPSIVRLKKEGGDLAIDECQMAVRFEFWPIDKDKEYYESKIQGSRDPAGMVVGGTLSAAWEELEKEIPEFAPLRKIAALTGALIWAREANVRVNPSVKTELWKRWKDTQGLRNPRIKEIKVKNPDGSEGLYHIMEASKEQKVTAESIARPAVLYNDHGPCRMLWEDGSQSVLEYEAGRVVRMVSRKGGVSRILYDAESRPAALVAPGGQAIAAFWHDNPPVLFSHVRVDADKAEYTPTDQTRVCVPVDMRAFFAGRIVDWLAAERQSDFRDVWLLGPASAIPLSSASKAWILWVAGPILLILGLAAAWQLKLRAVTLARVVAPAAPGSSGSNPVVGWSGGQSPAPRNDNPDIVQGYSGPERPQP